MKYKHALALLLVGFGLCIVGALFKIMHYPAAAALLLLGLGCEVLGGLLFLVKLLLPAKTKESGNE